MTLNNMLASIILEDIARAISLKKKKSQVGKEEGKSSLFPDDIIPYVGS